MNEALQDLEIKVENQGKTPQGRISAEEWNILVEAVKKIDINSGTGGGGGSIEYPLTWSGYSSGSYDGSVSKNIAIPSLLSQLTNDAGFATSAAVSAMLSDYATKDFVTSKGYITTESVNSLLTDYLPKSGGAVSGDITVTAGKISAPQFLASSAIYVNGGVRDCINIATSAAYPAIVMKGANHSGEVRLYNRGGADWVLTDEGWNNAYPILHSGNYSKYALPITGGTVNGNINAVRYISSGSGSVDNSGYQVNGGGVVATFGANPDTGGAYIWVSSGHALRFATNTTERMRITDVGNVAIGGTSADEKLHVYGNILATGGVTAQNTSDRRLKENIRDFDAISILRGMGGVHAYEYVDTEVARDTRYAGTHYGFIYQNVEGSELEKMCLKREDGYGTLNYLDPNLISVVAGGVLSLDDRVKLLEQENEQLRQEINQLNAKLS